MGMAGTGAKGGLHGLAKMYAGVRRWTSRSRMRIVRRSNLAFMTACIPRRLSAIVYGALLATSLLGCRPEREASGALADDASAKLIGSEFPAVSFPAVAGDSLRLPAKGHPTLVVFWASWCPPCLAEARELPTLRADLADLGLSLAGLNVDEETAAGALLARRLGMDWPVGLGALGFFDSLGLQSLPQAVLLDREGKVIEAFTGFYDRPVLEKAIRKALEFATRHP